MSDYYENYVDLDIDNISLNNNLFFNYNNEIEYKCTSNKKDNVLVINPGDKKCTAKFGNNPDVNMEISEIKIRGTKYQVVNIWKIVPVRGRGRGIRLF